MRRQQHVAYAQELGGPLPDLAGDLRGRHFELKHPAVLWHQFGQLALSRAGANCGSRHDFSNFCCSRHFAQRCWHTGDASGLKAFPYCGGDRLAQLPRI